MRREHLRETLQETRGNMDKLYKIFKMRLILLCMAVLIFVIATIHITVHVTSNSVIEQQLESSAMSVAVSIANHLMWNIEEYESFLETMDVTSDYYRRIQAFFADVKANSRIKYIYTERKIDEKTVEYILDAEPIGSPEYSPPGSTEPIDAQNEAVYYTGVPAGFKADDYSGWGKLLGAHAPIFDRNGELLGLVGVNIDGSHIYSYVAGLRTTLLVISMIILGLSWAALSRYSNAVLDPLLKDKLTGAYNKRYFEKLLQEEIARSVRTNKELALMMLDLDHFKKVNDTYGHVFGDKVLSSVSETIKRSLRPGDYFIRYGGEEFVVVITDSNIDQTLAIAERMRSAVENSPVFNEEKNLSVGITISIGVSGFKNLTVGAQELLENADKALYEAKVARNTVSLFTGGPGQDRPEAKP